MALKQHFVAVLALTAMLGCDLFESKVHVYVDNGGLEGLEVSVDGAEAVAVPTRAQAIVKLKPGTHRFVVRRREQVVYDASRDFAERDALAKYVLNPDMTRRYTTQVSSYRTYESGPRFDEGPGRALGVMVLLKPDPWVAGAFDDVFDGQPPDSVPVKRGSIQATRTRLCPIAPEDHDRLAAAQAEYLKALRTRPDQLPALDPETEAAVKRVSSACSGAKR